jgi:hypothetical protein
MPFTAENYEALRPTGDFIAVVPSFHVLIVPAIAGAVALGPFQGIAALAWLQVLQPAWNPGLPLVWLTQPMVLTLVTIAAVAECCLDKWPGLDARSARWKLRIVPILAAGLAVVALPHQPVDVTIGAALLSALLSSVIHCTIIPARESILASGTAPFLTPVASIVQSMLCFSLLLPMSQLPILAGVLLLVVILSCLFIMVLDRKPMASRWRIMLGLETLPPIPRPPERPSQWAIGRAESPSDKPNQNLD